MTKWASCKDSWAQGRETTQEERAHSLEGTDVHLGSLAAHI